MFAETFWNGGRSWDPWRELGRLQDEMNRLFTDFTGPRSAPDYVNPLVNVWTGPEGAVVTAEIPGMDPSSLEVSMLGRTLTLRGQREQPEPGEGETLHRRERGYGAFARSVELPFRVDASKVEARYARGVLRVMLPRAEDEKPRRVTVRAD